jgi:uncharacterized protein (DUF2252 family)
MTTLAQRIQQFNKDRLPGVLVRKYAAMSQDVFRFFRGSNHLFYEDLHRQPLFRNNPATWICGDLHIENFGSYKGDNRLVYFDINDFDEAMLAPFTWDAARMATSIVTACKAMNVAAGDADRLCGIFLDAYIETLARGKSRHVEKETARGILESFLCKVAERKTKDIIKQRCIKDASALKIDGVKQLALDEKEKTALLQQINKWIDASADGRYRFQAKDVAFRISGTGSLGQKRYVFLATKPDGKPVLLDMKQSVPPTGLNWIETVQPKWKGDAERIAWTQSFMQDEPPALLSPYFYKKQWYVLKALQPMDDKINYQLMAKDIPAMSVLVKEMGILAASAHLRGSGRKTAATADALMLAAKSKQLKPALHATAVSYAQRMDEYYHEFVHELAAGSFDIKK